MTRSRLTMTVMLSVGFGLVVAGRGSAQTLETESGRVLPSHAWEIGYAFEAQTSSEGTERAMPFALQYGITNTLELMVEPVAYTAIRPKTGRTATGAGDIEVTVTKALRPETRHMPAFAIAGELKIPTARDPLIGTGKTDVAVFGSGSKRFGPVDTHAHAAYTFVGQPSGVQLGNVFGFGVAAVYSASRRFDLFGEVLSNTASTPGGEGGSIGASVPIAPEATGGELVGTLGTSWRPRPWLTVYVSGSRDNIGAVLIRSGFVVRGR